MTASKKQPRWKREQSKKRKQASKLRVVAGLVFLSFIFSLIFGGYLWKRAALSVWDGKSRLAVIEKDKDDLVVKVVLPNQSRMVEFIIPNTTVVKVPFSYGEYQVSKIFELGSLDNSAGKLLTRSIQNLLAINITGFNYKNESNFSWLDKLRWLKFKMFLTKQSDSYNLLDYSGLSKLERKDGKEIYKPKQTLIDELVNTELFDQEIVDEGLSIAVVNGTDVIGVASLISRIVSNLGGEVRLTTNIDLKESSSIIVNKKEMGKTRTVEALSDILSISEPVVSETAEYRSNVVVVIGQDYVTLK